MMGTAAGLTRGVFGAVIFGLVFFAGGCINTDKSAGELDKQLKQIIDEKWERVDEPKADLAIIDPNEVNSQIELPAGKILTLADALAIAAYTSREYQSEKEQLYNKALDLSLSRYEFENQFFAGGSGGYSRTGGKSGAGGEVSVGLQRLLASGARISTKLSAAWIDIITGDVKSGLVSIFDITVTQPLLRGSQRKFVLEELTQAERDVLYQIRNFNRFRKTFLSDIITRYYRLLEEYSYVQNAKENYLALKETYRQIRVRTDAGRSSAHELDQAHQDVLQAMDVLAKRQKLYDQMLDDFKLALWLPLTLQFEIDYEHLNRLKLPEPERLDFTVGQAIDLALELRNDLANYSDMIADAERKVALAADRIGPELNVILSTRQYSKDSSELATLKTTKNTVGAGVEFDLPIDRKPEIIEYRRAELALNEARRQYQQAADEAVLEVRRAARRMLEAAEVYKIQKDNLELAKNRLERTALPLEYNRANTRDLLDARKDFFRAKDAVSSAIVDYSIAMIEFYRDTGVMQVRPDNSWQKRVTTGAEGKVKKSETKVKGEDADKKADDDYVKAESFIKQWLKKGKRQEARGTTR